MPCATRRRDLEERRKFRVQHPNWVEDTTFLLIGRYMKTRPNFAQKTGFGPTINLASFFDKC